MHIQWYLNICMFTRIPLLTNVCHIRRNINVNIKFYNNIHFGFCGNRLSHKYCFSCPVAMSKRKLQPERCVIEKKRVVETVTVRSTITGEGILGRCMSSQTESVQHNCGCLEQAPPKSAGDRWKFLQPELVCPKPVITRCVSLRSQNNMNKEEDIETEGNLITILSVQGDTVNHRESCDDGSIGSAQDVDVSIENGDNNMQASQLALCVENEEVLYCQPSEVALTDYTDTVVPGSDTTPPHHPCGQSAQSDTTLPHHPCGQSAQSYTAPPHHPCGQSAQSDTAPPHHPCGQSAQSYTAPPHHPCGQSAQSDTTLPHHPCGQSAQSYTAPPHHPCGQSAQSDTTPPRHQFGQSAQLDTLSDPQGKYSAQSDMTQPDSQSQQSDRSDTTEPPTKADMGTRRKTKPTVLPKHILEKVEQFVSKKCGSDISWIHDVVKLPSDTLHVDSEADDACLFGNLFCEQENVIRDQATQEKKSSAVGSDEHDEESGDISKGKRNPRKPPPNYFVAVQITNPQIHSGLSQVQQEVMSVNHKMKEVMIKLPTLHFTLMVMNLQTEEDIARASAALNESGCELRERFKTLPVLEVAGLGTFRNQVVFATVSPGDALDDLTHIHQCVIDKMADRGVVSTEMKGLTPHITIMKMSKVKAAFKRSVAKKIDPCLYSKFKDVTFGTETVQRLQLCAMLKPKDPSGYYHVEHEVYLGQGEVTVSEFSRCLVQSSIVSALEKVKMDSVMSKMQVHSEKSEGKPEHKPQKKKLKTKKSKEVKK